MGLRHAQPLVLENRGDGESEVTRSIRWDCDDAPRSDEVALHDVGSDQISQVGLRPVPVDIENAPIATPKSEVTRSGGIATAPLAQLAIALKVALEVTDRSGGISTLLHPEAQSKEEYPWAFGREGKAETVNVQVIGLTGASPPARKAPGNPSPDSRGEVTAKRGIMRSGHGSYGGRGRK